MSEPRLLQKTGWWKRLYYITFPFAVHLHWHQHNLTKILRQYTIFIKYINAYYLINVRFCSILLKICRRSGRRDTCSWIELCAVSIINVLLSDVKLWQSDGVHLHRVACLPHKLQVVCRVANWMRGMHQNTSTMLKPHYCLHKTHI